ncbi:MAG TPA: exopolysaccharide biosynthesis protein [Kofleriaceae bacterium]|nr:exopolysaccharide biosynthesis protein [Kofleriaceae bacterium]
MDVERAREVIAAEKPRRLRLDEMLRDMGARLPERKKKATRRSKPGIEPRASQQGIDPRASDAGISDDGMPSPDTTLDERRPITMGELVDRAAEAGFGFLIGVLALIAIPFFGLSTPFGLAIALVGGQLAIGRKRPWLPKRTRRRVLAMRMLDRVLGLLDRRLRWLAQSTRRRWEVLITPRLVGVGITFLALGLALPLPIPGSNLIFIVPILIYAIGLLERDGKWVVVGHICTLVDLALLIAFGATVVAVLERAWQWVF